MNEIAVLLRQCDISFAELVARHGQEVAEGTYGVDSDGMGLDNDDRRTALELCAELDPFRMAAVGSR